MVCLNTRVAQLQFFFAYYFFTFAWFRSSRLVSIEGDRRLEGSSAQHANVYLRNRRGALSHDCAPGAGAEDCITRARSTLRKEASASLSSLAPRTLAAAASARLRRAVALARILRKEASAREVYQCWKPRT